MTRKTICRYCGKMITDDTSLVQEHGYKYCYCNSQTKAKQDEITRLGQELQALDRKLEKLEAARSPGRRAERDDVFEKAQEISAKLRVLRGN